MTEQPKPPRSGRAGFYAAILPHAIAAARQCGYAIGMHGSMVSDLDLIAVPWVEDAAPAEALVAAVAQAIGAYVPTDCARRAGDRWDPVRFPEERPHGRMVWAICYGGEVYVDLSVMPRANQC